MNFSNLPPGISEGDIPGNRPEDEEIEVFLILSQGDIDDLRRYYDAQMKLPITERHVLWAIVSNIVDQLEEQGL